jgi:hypothetical protein
VLVATAALVKLDALTSELKVVELPAICCRLLV